MTIMTGSSQIRVLRPYLVYVISFVGAGMVSGGVVHYPLNENFYGALAIFGGVVFALGSLANEILSGKGFPKVTALLSLIFTSLMLSFGIGMLSGGIQHFTDFPARAALLIPTGIMISFLAFCVKANLFKRSALMKLLVSSVLVIATAVCSLLILTNVARHMSVKEHSHTATTSQTTNSAEDHSKHPHN